MKTSLKTSLVIIALVLIVCLAGLVWFVSRPDEWAAAASGPATSPGPSFDVSVEKPRRDRFLAGILPMTLETKLLGGELRFHHGSRGAKIGRVGHDRVELSADGWNLLIVTDGKGAIAPETRLVFPIEIAEKVWTLRCRPADPATGYFQASTQAGSGKFAGRFLIEIAKCEDAETGEILDTEAGGNPGDEWPSDPLTLRGSFAGLPLSPP